MSYQPIEQVAALSIGTIESVSPASIGVLLNTDAPQATALNTGHPTGFPRINSYVLVPNESGALVGLVVWIGIERSQFPKRTGLKDYGLVDLPYPTRKLSLTPVGTLARQPSPTSESVEYRLERGVVSFPSVGDSVQLPTQEQLKGIVQASADEDKRVWVGTSPAAGEVNVTVDPDKIFGRHLAVLGNTGSGKSCSVAGLIRWSLESAKRHSGNSERANARFVILDPNGEYASAFADSSDVRVYQVPSGARAVGEPLTLAGWMWNSEEWSAFSRASGATQRPLLLQALRDLRSQERLRDPPERQATRILKSYRISIEGRISGGTTSFQEFQGRSELGQQLARMKDDLEFHARQTEGELSSSISALAQEVAVLEEARKVPGRWFYNSFSEVELRSLVAKIDDCLSTTAAASESPSVS